MRFGKLPPKRDYRTLVFAAYLKDDVPEPPDKIDQVDRVCINLGRNDVPALFPMYANDELGDCTIAGMAHGVTLHHGMVKQTHIPAEKEVIRIYNQLTGGVDSGLYMLDVVKFWRSTGIEQSKLFAYATVNPYNRTHVKQAISLFGGLIIGFQCQEKVVEEFSAGKPWQPGKLMNAGHCVYVTGYDYDGIECLTWGNLQRGSWAWWNACVDEAYVVLPPEATLPGFAPGFDFKKLQDDLQLVSRHL